MKRTLYPFGLGWEVYAVEINYWEINWEMNCLLPVNNWDINESYWFKLGFSDGFRGGDKSFDVKNAGSLKILYFFSGDFE